LPPFRYAYNTDKDLVLLKIVGATDEKPIGAIAWYAVHPVSMNNTNPYISSDNKGYAELLFEEEMNGPNVMPGKGSFIAAFGASNLGDVSPNIQGAKCKSIKITNNNDSEWN
jgi:neutral ceramidase